MLLINTLKNYENQHRSGFLWALENRRDHIKEREIGKRRVGFIVQKLKLGLFTNSSLILLARLCQVYRGQLPRRLPTLLPGVSKSNILAGGHEG
jgi:hypothetical protein